jgi:hypothetical protein
MPSFNFFKRKKRNVSNFDVKDSESHSNLSTSPQQEHDNRLSINDALILLEKMEQDATRSLLIELDKVFDDTNQVLKHINNVAEDLSKEEIVIEEEKLTPLVKNTKNTIVRALKRESSNILSKPKNFEDFVNFKDSLDSSINRFGEVTSSHSRIVNTFMKKHANSLRADLKKISDYLEKLNDGYTNIEQEKSIIESLRSNLLNVKSKNNDINNTANTIKIIEDGCKKLKELIDKNKNEISELKSSSDYEKGLKYLKEKESIDKEKALLQSKLRDISGHLVKAANKYSYGLTQSTVEKINLLVSNPEEVAKKNDMSEYIRLLHEIKESIKTNKIILKDSNKMIPYFDILAQELPSFKSQMEKIDARIEKLKDKDKISIINKVKEKETENKFNIDQYDTDIKRKNDLLRSKSDFENSIKTYLLDIEEQFLRLSTKKYKLILGSE